jgi:hypothetical protein
MTVCAGACALTATATQWASDSFEAGGDGYTNATADMAIGTYKMIVTGDQSETTNLAWVATSGDASKIIVGDTPFTGTATRPIAGATTDQYLNLETEGQTLSRVLAAPQSFETSSVFVDTLIKFTPSEDTPTIDDLNVKVAIYVNASSNLVIHHATYDVVTMDSGVTNTVVDGTIDPTAWYRLTIEMGQPGGGVGRACKVFLNGSVISHANAFTEGEDIDPVPGGLWFMTVASGLDLNAVAFQGTGAVDELVVTSEIEPFSSAILLTLAFNPSMVSVTTNGAAADNFAQVASGTEVAITALPWFEITAAGDLFTSTGATNLVASMKTSYIGTVDGTDGQTNAIAAQLWSDTAAVTATGFGSTYPANKVAAWAFANSLTAVDAGMEDDYLFNVAPGTDAKPVIKSIAVDGDGNATITVEADKPLINFSDLNGALVVKTADSLSEGLTVPGEGVTVTPGSSAAEITVEFGNGHFIQAVVQ